MIITSTQSMHKHTPKTNPVFTVYNCASILWLQFLVLNIAIYRVNNNNNNNNIVYVRG